MGKHSAKTVAARADATEISGFVRSAEPGIAPQHEREPRRRPSGRVLAGGMAVALICIGVAAVGWSEGSHSGSATEGAPEGATVEKTASAPGTAPAFAVSSSATDPSSTSSHSAQSTQIVFATVVGAQPTAGSRAQAGATSPGDGPGSDTSTPSSTAHPANSDTPPAGYGTTDLALNRRAAATSYTETYVPANITDGNAGSYWEGSKNSFPQTATVDLGSIHWVAELKLSLPPIASWNSRTQTIAIYGSRSGTNPTETLADSARYAFNANNSSDDAVTITFTPTKTRYLILRFTANNGWYAAQLSELSAYS